MIGSNVGGIPDQILDGESGVLLSDAGDLDAFGSIVAGLVRDDARRTKMGEAAHVRARDEFLATRYLMQYATIVSQLIQAG